MKKCGICLREISVLFFNKNKNTIDGHGHYCKACIKSKRPSRRTAPSSILNFPNEEWLDIPGYEGAYSVSNYGRIKTLEKNCLGGRFQNRVVYERLRKPCVSNKGYLKVQIRYKQYSIHRLVAMAFIPNPKKLPEVNHKDFNKKNNSISNLEWCDGEYNVSHYQKSLRA